MTSPRLAGDRDRRPPGCRPCATAALHCITPGAHNASARALELVQQALEILMRAETAPTSPVTTFLTAKMRRELRRNAARLRQGKAEPRYKNLYTAEELAAVYERTALRDEMFEQGNRDLQRIARDLGRILERNPPGLQKTMEAFVREAKRSAEEQGPGSEAARRYGHVLGMAWLGYQRHSDARRQRTPAPRHVLLPPDPSVEARNEQSAAEILTSPPSPDAAVIAIPPQGEDSGRGRMFLRIGIGEKSWIGSFERGHARVSTVLMLPDGKHLFVSAGGAGYVIDAKSRTLVERTGTEVVGAIRDEPFTLLVLDHNGRSLEAFGRTGRLWKTDAISSGGFRRMASRPTRWWAKRATRRGWDGWDSRLSSRQARWALCRRDGRRGRSIFFGSREKFSRE